MKVSLLLILAFLGAFICEEIPDNNATSNDKSQNPRIVLNNDELVFRQAIFLENLDKMNQFNQDESNTYKMSLNQFSDMTEEEFAAKILTSNVQPNKDDQDIVPSEEEEMPPSVANSNLRFQLFKQVDWRNKGAVTSVKNQGQCGSCWAFSAVGLMESFNFIKNNSMKDFSEQQLVDCVIPSNGYSSYGCIGGWPQQAIMYTKHVGILQESQYPYVAIQGKCKVNAPTSGFYVRSYKKLVSNVSELKKALDFSPVSVLVDATKWGSYGSGIFSGCSSTVNLNHAVLLVGYDIFGNWIIKNQWRTSWGESGYMRLKAGDSCGIAQSTYQITA